MIPQQQQQGLQWGKCTATSNADLEPIDVPEVTQADAYEVMVAAMFPDRDTDGDPPGPSSSSQDHGYVTPQTEQLFMSRAHSEDAEVQRQQHYTKEHLRIAEIHNNRGKPQWKQEDWTSYDDSSRQDTWQQSSSSSGVAREPDDSIHVMHMPPRYNGEWKDDGWQHDEWQEEQAPWLSGKTGKQKGKRQHTEQDWNRPPQGKGEKGRNSKSFHYDTFSLPTRTTASSPTGPPFVNIQQVQ